MVELLLIDVAESTENLMLDRLYYVLDKALEIRSPSRRSLDPRSVLVEYFIG